MTTKFYKYAHCGNVIQKVVDSKVLVFCCGQNLDGENLVDCFCKAEDGSMTLLPSKWVDTRNTHGTGYTLSSAFAAALAKGEGLTQAAVCAKKYIEQAIIAGTDYEIGQGHG